MLAIVALLLLASCAAGQSTSRWSYPTNCCRWRFQSPSVPHVSLPAAGENCDPVLVRGNPIVDGAAPGGGTAAKCNSTGQPMEWNVEAREWQQVPENELALRVENGVVRSDPPASEAGESQRLKLMAGRLVQLEVTCAEEPAPSAGSTPTQQRPSGANCLQLWVGAYDEREAQRPPCLRLAETNPGVDAGIDSNLADGSSESAGLGNSPPPRSDVRIDISGSPPLRPNVSLGVVLFSLALVLVAMELLLVVNALQH